MLFLKSNKLRIRKVMARCLLCFDYIFHIHFFTDFCANDKVSNIGHESMISFGSKFVVNIQPVIFIFLLEHKLFLVMSYLRLNLSKRTRFSINIKFNSTVDM